MVILPLRMFLRIPARNVGLSAPIVVMILNLYLGIYRIGKVGALYVQKIRE